MFALRKVPGPQEIDAGVVAAADAVQGEGEAAQGLLHEVFVVRAYVGCAGWGKCDALGVGEKGGEVVVVLGGRWWWRGEFEEAAGEGGYCWIKADWALGEVAGAFWCFLECLEGCGEMEGVEPSHCRVVEKTPPV